MQNNLEWPDPEPIQHSLSPVMSLSECNLPESYREWITDVSHRMQCPIDFVAVAAIVMTGSIIGAGCGIKPKRKDDWLVIPNLWGGVVGRPGMLKTPAVSEVMQLISHLESEAKQAFDACMANYSAEFEDYKAQKEALKSAMLNAKKQVLKNKPVKLEALTLKNQLKELIEPPRPIWQRYKTNDGTIEKISELLADNPRGLLIYRDELMGLLATWDQEGRESDRTFFMEAWNGYGSLTSDRIGRGTIHTKNLCLSVFGNTQPAKLTRYLYNAMRGTDNDGLLQRFQLMIYPDEIKKWQLIDQAPNCQARERVSSTVKKLSAMDFTQQGANQEANDRFPYFRFNQESQELFFYWLEDHEKKIVDSDEQPIFVEHLSKYRSLVPSLALIFHLIEIANGSHEKLIGYDVTLKAISWCSYLESHAKLIYGMATDVASHASIKLAKKIKEGELRSNFSLRDIYRKHWGFLDDKDHVKKACDEFIDAGWLRKETIQSEIGRPKLPNYIINPKIVVENQQKNFC